MSYLPPSSCNSRRRRFGIYKLINNDHIYLYYGCHVPISRPLPPPSLLETQDRLCLVDIHNLLAVVVISRLTSTPPHPHPYPYPPTLPTPTPTLPTPTPHPPHPPHRPPLPPNPYPHHQHPPPPPPTPTALDVTTFSYILLLAKDTAVLKA